MDFEPVWTRITGNAGAEFRQKSGRPFTYTVNGSAVIPSTTNQNLPRSDFQKAYDRAPLTGPGMLQDLQGPSYLRAILTDERIAPGARV